MEKGLPASEAAFRRENSVAISTGCGFIIRATRFTTATGWAFDCAGRNAICIQSARMQRFRKKTLNAPLRAIWQRSKPVPDRRSSRAQSPSHTANIQSTRDSLLFTIYPIAFIKYKTAIGISATVCCFSPAGRKKIHDNLEMDTTLFAYLREHPPQGHSLEYADCRLSLLSAQKGKCAVSGEWFLQPDSIVCHMKVPKEQGGQERYSNLVLLHRRYLPLLTDQDAAALKSICKQMTVTRKQLTKINNLRTAAKLAAI